MFRLRESLSNADFPLDPPRPSVNLGRTLFKQPGELEAVVESAVSLLTKTPRVEISLSTAVSLLSYDSSGVSVNACGSPERNLRMLHQHLLEVHQIFGRRTP